MALANGIMLLDLLVYSLAKTALSDGIVAHLIPTQRDATIADLANHHGLVPFFAINAVLENLVILTDVVSRVKADSTKISPEALRAVHVVVAKYPMLNI